MSIKILPARLANQIAAGEVVERPASVIKELLENSLDANATLIEIDIEKGGSQLIRIRDNGVGITKDELVLALSRHATSKISSLDDLESILSLGFRGEALASISSVSRLTLTSKTKEQTAAWSAYAEGRDMQVKLKPAAHPIGTTIEVLDLFFNTPARKKFLRSDKTEFNHIEETIKRVALSRLDVTFIVRHNGKQIKAYQAVSAKQNQERRIAAICGKKFMQNALYIESQTSQLKIYGWIATPTGARAYPDLQYSYVNGRIMRDKVIRHAIRQAYITSLDPATYPAYVLYIEIDPQSVDVNVHPTKHEVRFHQPRLVHDFIYSSLNSALLKVAQEESVNWDIEPPAVLDSAYANPDIGSTSLPEKDMAQSCLVANSDTKSQDKYYQGNYPKLQFKERSYSQTSETNSLYTSLLDTTEVSTYYCGIPLSILEKTWLLLQNGAHLGVVNLFSLERLVLQSQLLNGVTAQPLLIPVALNFNKLWYKKIIENNLDLFIQLGFDFKLHSPNKVIVLKVPKILRNFSIQRYLPFWLDKLENDNVISYELLVNELVNCLEFKKEEYQLSQAIVLLSQFEQNATDDLTLQLDNLIKELEYKSLLKEQPIE